MNYEIYINIYVMRKNVNIYIYIYIIYVHTYRNHFDAVNYFPLKLVIQMLL